MDHDEVLLEDPKFDIAAIRTTHPTAVVEVGGLEATFPPTEFTPRAVRTFLWENRKSRAVMRDRAVLKVDRSDDNIRISIAAVTHEDAALRLVDNHG